MSSYTGKSWRLNRVAKGTPDVYYDLGGYVISAEPKMPAEALKSVVTAQRKLGILETALVKPAISFVMDIAVLADYITAYCMVTGEGDVPAHTLYFTDGAENFDFSDAKVTRCELTQRQTEPLRAAIEVLAKSHATPSIGTFLGESVKPMFKTALTTLSISGTAITNWQEFGFGVNNNVAQEFLGTDLMPAEVFEQAAEYFGHILLSRKAASKFGTVKAGTKGNVVIALQDRCLLYITKTFTFTNALLESSVITVRELNLELERIEWAGDALTIS